MAGRDALVGHAGGCVGKRAGSMTPIRVPAPAGAARRAPRRPIDRFDAGFFGISPREAEQHRPPAAPAAGGGLGGAGGRRAAALERLSAAAGRRRLRRRSPRYDYEPDAARRDGGGAIDAVHPTPAVVADHRSPTASRYCFDFQRPEHGASTPPAPRRWSPCTWPARACWRASATLALAGGVNVMLTPDLHDRLRKAGFLSPTAAASASTRGADGYVRGEGAGVVVLKPLARRPSATATRSTPSSAARRSTRTAAPTGITRAERRRRRQRADAAALRDARASRPATVSTSRRTAPARRWATRSRRSALGARPRRRPAADDRA